MITRQRIIRIADADGVPAATVERDYVLSHCLYAIAASPESERFVFKGGTALRMSYFEAYRYSADLDLSLTADLPREEAIEAIGHSFRDALQDIGFPRLEIVAARDTMIEYEGPLGRVRRLELDLDQEELVFSAERRSFLQRYEDVGPSAGLPTYSLVEIAAEKLRCVMQRLQCRDFYDLHQLFEDRLVDRNDAWEMFEAKARHKNIDPGDFFKRFEARIPHYEDRWVDEMSDHVLGELPPFKTALRQLRRHIRPFRQ